MMQMYIPYWEWEDWLNGMWSRLPPQEESDMLEIVTEFTGDHVRYGEAMKRVVKEWPKTMLNSLTNTSINPRAFVGHCACCLELGCPEYITRMAWKKLTEQQRKDADAVAQRVVDEWRVEYDAKQSKAICENVAEPMLF